jgi:DegV family protein with EDD domain
MIKVVADSTCNLPEEIVKQYDIRVAPIAVQIGSESYLEGVDITPPQFYQRLAATGVIPTSSQPPPAWFERLYRQAQADGHTPLVVTVTSKHSGTYQSAVLATRLVPKVKVEVFDSESVSLGTGWMVVEAARLAQEGADLPSIMRRLETIRSQLLLFLTPATLKFLQASGRVTRLQGALGSLLDVKPIITIQDGTLEAIERVRTRRRAIGRLLELIATGMASAKGVNLAAIHANAPEEGLQMLERARAMLPVREVLYGELAPSLAVHAGEGVLGMGAYPVE